MRFYARSQDKLTLLALLGIICFALFFFGMNHDEALAESVDMEFAAMHVEESIPRFSNALQANILDFFNVKEHDALQIRWKHAVNSLKRLESSLMDDSVHMLECDVILSEDGVPICAHPPQTKSDLLVQVLVGKLVNSGTKKGLKLDFKQLEAVPATLRILGSSEFRNQLQVPIWLNADILGGPGGLLTPKINARKFIRECLFSFRWATLSLGWTTGDGSRSDSAKLMHYTPAMVREMLNLLSEFGVPTIPEVANDNPEASHDHNQSSDSDAAIKHVHDVGTSNSSGTIRTDNKVNIPRAASRSVQVTYPVNALLLTGSLNALFELVKSAPASFSLTVWSPFGDDLKRVPTHILHDARTALRQMRAAFDRRNVFYDLDPTLRSALEGDSITASVSVESLKKHNKEHPKAAPNDNEHKKDKVAGKAKKHEDA